MTTFPQLCRRRTRCRDKRDVDRGGSVTLEFLLVLPILLIVLLATIEFGMYFSRMQQVALAARVGAEVASQTGSLPASGTVPTNITDAVDHQLKSSGITYGAVILQHNVNGPPETLTSPSGSTCPPPTAALPPQPTAGHGRLSVRVTVYVPMTQLAPNCLTVFGFNLSGRSARSSTTFRYEG